MTKIRGIHHVTAISGAPQPNVDFFNGVLGQKLVKKTVNFDDPGTYHLYYGDAAGNPGTILTFFPFADAGRGKAGPGMASAYAYAIPTADFDRITDDMAVHGLTTAGAGLRFGERVVTLRDPDGAPVELIESADASDTHGFHSVTLWERDPERTLRLLTDVFGYRHLGTESEGTGERHRLVAEGSERGRFLDVIQVPGALPGRQGAGTIHHIAFRTKDDAEQAEWMDRLASAGHRTTDVKDRQYFNAIYFREPGGVLFEIATDPPGFAIDEPAESLGRSLKLPQQYEPMRARIERVLPPLRVPA
ncbi:MAG: ring-cleaving dioxygenase [Cypionkella sp.]|nr:ring-cleaving dioxygenase [Cypionkella sp.]